MKSFTYQNRRKKDYFEGWYTRLVDIENNINIAVIFALQCFLLHLSSWTLLERVWVVEGCLSVISKFGDNEKYNCFCFADFFHCSCFCMSDSLS